MKFFNAKAGGTYGYHFYSAVTAVSLGGLGEIRFVSVFNEHLTAFTCKLDLRVETAQRDWSCM
jgi:hypothetical protein